MTIFSNSTPVPIFYVNTDPNQYNCASVIATTQFGPYIMSRVLAITNNAGNNPSVLFMNSALPHSMDPEYLCRRYNPLGG